MANHVPTPALCLCFCDDLDGACSESAARRSAFLFSAPSSVLERLCPSDWAHFSESANFTQALTHLVNLSCYSAALVVEPEALTRTNKHTPLCGVFGLDGWPSDRVVTAFVKLLKVTLMLSGTVGS